MPVKITLFLIFNRSIIASELKYVAGSFLSECRINTAFGISLLARANDFNVLSKNFLPWFLATVPTINLLVKSMPNFWLYFILLFNFYWFNLFIFIDLIYLWCKYYDANNADFGPAIIRNVSAIVIIKLVVISKRKV